MTPDDVTPQVRHILAARKLCYVFDVEKLRSYILQTKERDLSWPNYSGLLHNPVENAMMVTEKIVLLEGNDLLYNAEPWNSLEELPDDSVFIEIAADVLEDRLINRLLNWQEAFFCGEI